LAPFALFAFFSVLHIPASYSQLVVSMKDSVYVCKGLDFPVSVEVSGIQSVGSLIAYQIKISFNKNLLSVIDVDFKSSLFAGWIANTWNVNDSTISIAGFSVEDFQAAADSALLFNIQFSVNKDTVCTDSIKVISALFYSVNDVIQAELKGRAFISFIHNTPPVVNHLPKINIFEDSTESILLASNISDENNSINELSISIISSEPGLQPSLDTTNWKLLLRPLPNWSGNGILSIKAEDPLGLSDSISVPFTVISLPDPPGTFSLISPEDSSMHMREGPVSFIWNSSKNVDTGDSIYYRFYLDKDSVFLSPERIVSLPDTTFTMSTFPGNGVYFWKVVAYDNDGLYTMCDKIFKTYFMIISSVDTVKESRITSFDLCQNRPNPFNSCTEIVYKIPEREYVTINIYNTLGKFVKTLANRVCDRGSYKVIWNAKDDWGENVPSGVYIVRMNAGKFYESRKIILIR